MWTEVRPWPLPGYGVLGSPLTQVATERVEGVLGGHCLGRGQLDGTAGPGVRVDDSVKHHGTHMLGQ